MAIRVRVKGFKPTVNGLHFINKFPHEPDYPSLSWVNNLLPISLNDANNGLCGGMVFTVKDCFDSEFLPPADTLIPSPSSALFNYIVCRQTHSLDWDDVNKYLSWINMRDGDHWYSGAGVANHEITEEWPQIQADLEAGQVCPIGLVAGQELEPFGIGYLAGVQDLKNCHQVLAWGYDLDDANNLNIYIYDPDNIGNNNMIMLNIGDPHNATGVAVTNWGGEYRGFFRMHYEHHDPTSPVTAAFVVDVVSSPGITPAGRIPPRNPIASNSVRDFLNLNHIPLDSTGSLVKTLGGFAPGGDGLRKVIGAV